MIVEQTIRPEDKIVGALIFWGVCEVLGWGYQLRFDRVFKEMREVGLVVTEFGPEGFLPSGLVAMVSVLFEYGLQAVGGFILLLLYVLGNDSVFEVDCILDSYVVFGAQVLVLSVIIGSVGYDTRSQLDKVGWKRLFCNLDRVVKLAVDRSVWAVLHPHVGTMIETGNEVQQALDGSSISLCLDTGHLLIGGTDFVELVRQAFERIAHLYLKDVDSTVAVKVGFGQFAYSEVVE